MPGLTMRQKESLIEEFLNGETIKALARYYSICPKSVRRFLVSAGVHTPVQTVIGPNKTCCACKKIFPRSSEFFSVLSKANKQPGSRDKLCSYCYPCDRERKAGFDRRNKCIVCGETCDRKAKKCVSCNSARDYDYFEIKDGYKLVYCPGHPNCRKKDGLILEHRLVMERMLERFLLPGENVHHKNGVRADNRPSNLELWVVSQPSGQRPEDLVVWAQEILSRYSPELLVEARLKLAG